MSGPIPIAFYAPLKAPDDPVPSGDRRMGRLLLQALAQAGFSPAVASRLKTLDKTGDGDIQVRLMNEARAEAERLTRGFLAGPAQRRPRLWFTYHVYYKAPDWIGPEVARKLAIPYVIAEGSRAAKRAYGPWRLSHAGAEVALDEAAMVFVLNEADRPALANARPPGQSLVDLPPFLDTAEDGDALKPDAASGSSPLLLTVAMMRPGDKLASYRLLAEALSRIERRPWRLAVVGDGEARGEVERALAPFAGRTAFHGLIEDGAALGRLYAAADLFVWPAVNEAYGMALLEAQAAGCPVVAGRFGGVPQVLRDGETGLIAVPGDAGAFAAAVAALLDDPPRRRAMGLAARRFIRSERTVPHAAAILRAALAPLVAERAPA